jgi:hypothetical protein
MDNGAVFHILPKDDSEEHFEGMSCKCKPDVISFESGISLVIHNSFDNREIKEDLLREIVNPVHCN